MKPKRYPLDKPKARALVIGWAVEGKTSTEIQGLLRAHRIDVSSAAVRAFNKRHAEEIAALAGKVADAVEADTIASQLERFRLLDKHARAVDAAIDAEGYFVKEVHYLGKGEDAEPVVTQRFDYPRVKSLLEVLRAAAEEHGDIIRRSESVVTGGKDAGGDTLAVPIRIVT